MNIKGRIQIIIAILLLLSFGFPIFINWVVSCPPIGDYEVNQDSIWLSFWSTWGATILSVLVPFYLLYINYMQAEKNHQSAQMLQLNVFAYGQKKDDFNHMKETLFKMKRFLQGLEFEFVYHTSKKQMYDERESMVEFADEIRTLFYQPREGGLEKSLVDEFNKFNKLYMESFKRRVSAYQLFHEGYDEDAYLVFMQDNDSDIDLDNKFSYENEILRWSDFLRTDILFAKEQCLSLLDTIIIDLVVERKLVIETELKEL